MDQSNYEEGSEIEQIIEEVQEEVGDIGDPEEQRDFSVAYQKLIEKVSHDKNKTDLLLNQQEYSEMQRKAKLKKELKQRTEERVKNFQENKRKKVELLKQENKKKEMEECTFAPQTYSRPDQKRTWDEILDD